MARVDRGAEPPFPIDLEPIGMTGCLQYHDIADAIPVRAGALGMAA